MSNCQKDVKCQKFKYLNYEGGSQKKIDTMRFTDIDVKYEGHQKLLKNIFYAHFDGFWLPSYVMSKLMSICVDLII